MGVRPSLIFESVLRAFRWHRRWFAAVLAAIAVVSGINAFNSRTAGAVPVVTAARTVGGGTTLTAADLTISWLPAATLPEGYLGSTEALIGQQVVTEVPRRAVLTSSALLSRGAGVAPGKLALPIRFGDGVTITLLDVGSRIDVLGPGNSGQGYVVVAAELRVVAVPQRDSSGMLGSQVSELVMVEVEQPQAVAITAAASIGTLSYALH